MAVAWLYLFVVFIYFSVSSHFDLEEDSRLQKLTIWLNKEAESDARSRNTLSLHLYLQVQETIYVSPRDSHEILSAIGGVHDLQNCL